jgi:hypothetical protein
MPIRQRTTLNRIGDPEKQPTTHCSKTVTRGEGILARTMLDESTLHLRRLFSMLARRR